MFFSQCMDDRVQRKHGIVCENCLRPVSEDFFQLVFYLAFPELTLNGIYGELSMKSSKTAPAGKNGILKSSTGHEKTAFMAEDRTFKAGYRSQLLSFQAQPGRRKAAFIIHGIFFFLQYTEWQKKHTGAFLMNHLLEKIKQKKHRLHEIFRCG